MGNMGWDGTTLSDLDIWATRYDPIRASRLVKILTNGHLDGLLSIEELFQLGKARRIWGKLKIEHD